MTDEDFAELLARGHELTEIECKPPGPRSDRDLFASVARAVMGMANRRDGGLVIIGVRETSRVLTPLGLNDADLATWTHDDTANSLATFVDPYVVFDREAKGYGGRNYIIFHVREFEEIPVLCKRDYRDVLRAGACYFRPRGKAETVEIRSLTEMRELLELAIDKGVQKFVRRAHAAGLDIAGPRRPTDEDLYRAQREEPE